MNLADKTESIIENLFAGALESDFGGDDPFDGLNAYPFRRWPKWQDSWLGLAWTQLFKRSPLNFRRITGVPKQRNPKGVALFISGMLLENERNPQPELVQRAKQLGNWLVEQMSDQDVWGAPSWGYHFPWKARAFFVPLGKPNLITTVYVSKALYDLGKLCNDSNMVDIALRSADFIVDKLYVSSEQGDYFRYIPDESALVHNANLWAAAWVMKSAHIRDIPEHKELARLACETSVYAQNDDGSWPYGARSHHQFIDGFHTGYNLETLNILNQYWHDSSLQPVIEKGFAYYKETLISSDGTAKYYHNNAYPLDTHNFAQAIITISKLGITEADKNLTKNIILSCIKNLFLEKDRRFVYHKDKYITNSINYSRWTQSWAYFAFNLYLSEAKAPCKE